MKTVVGLYKTMAEANKVKTALASEGYDSSDITVIDQTDSSYKGTGSANTGSDDASIGGRIKNFFGGLTGHDDDSHRSYEQGVTGGGALLAVTVPDEEAEETADMLYSHGASEIQGGYGGSNYGSAGYTGSSTGAGAEDVAVLQANAGYDKGASTTGEQVIPVVAEELQVGKRQVERGGVRIYSRVVSEPVSDTVALHDERVVVDRHVVDRPANEADFATGTGAIEVTAVGEEAVVGKRSRVVEEILVGKEASDRVEQVSDSVRHTEVEVQPTTTTTSTTGTGVGGTRSDL